MAYVPGNKAAKIDVTQWMEATIASVNGEIIAEAAPAESPNGGLVVQAVVMSDPAIGKYAIKDKDTAMAAAFAYLRAHNAFPDGEDDDEDEICFGDDAFDNIDDL